MKIIKNHINSGFYSYALIVKGKNKSSEMNFELHLLI